MIMLLLYNLSMNWNASYKSGQDNYNKFERLFKGSSNYQEEQQEASSEQAPAELNPWEKMAQEVLNEQPHTTETAYEKAENVEKGAESEKIEETVPEEKLEKLSSGEKTTIYRSENENGEKKVVLESDYFRLANQFRDSHPELQSTDNTDIDLAFMGLSSDLAMIDATHGKNLRDGAENLRESLTDDYSKLRTKFEDPNTPAKDKQLIAEYFETMDGEALSFLKASFSRAEEVKRQEEAEKDVERKRFEEEFEDVKERLERVRGRVEEDMEDFNKLTKELDDAYHANEDPESLQAKLGKVRNVLETLDSDNKKFSNTNANYDVLLNLGYKFLGQQAEVERQTVLDNVEYVHRNIKKIDLADEQIRQIGKQIAILREAKSVHNYRW